MVNQTKHVVGPLFEHIRFVSAKAFVYEIAIQNTKFLNGRRAHNRKQTFKAHAEQNDETTKTGAMPCWNPKCYLHQ